MTTSNDPAAMPLHVLTFVTRTGGVCYYATYGRYASDGSVEPLRLPPQIQAQLDALQARVAWWIVCARQPFRVRGEAADVCRPVDTPDSLDRLVFV